MIMITGRFSPLPAVATLDMSSRLFGLRASARGKRSEWARLAWSANDLAFTAAKSLRTSEGCEERDANVGVLSHLTFGGFMAIYQTILPIGGQSFAAYTPLGNDDRNVSPRTTKYRCWSLREGLDSRK